MEDPARNPRRVLVTGASSGIGAAVVRQLAGRGDAVAALARNRPRLEDVVRGAGDAHVVPADVTDLGAVTAAVDEAAGSMGGIDALVNCAGVAMPGGVVDGQPEHWRTMFEVNVLGLLHATRATLPYLREAEVADVVNISSMSGRRVASPELAIYAGSKHAVHAISQGMALELRDTPVRVTVVSPGYVDTPIFEGVDEEYAGRAEALGLGPDDVADQVRHVLDQPPGVRLVEVAMVSTRQG